VVGGVTGTQTAFDTARLGGGAAILRVAATDGTQSAHVDSAPFTMANKTPVPSILQPGYGDTFSFEQLINFSGAARGAGSLALSAPPPPSRGEGALAGSLRRG
jgi:hypothetical protein